MNLPNQKHPPIGIEYVENWNSLHSPLGYNRKRYSCLTEFNNLFKLNLIRGFAIINPWNTI